MCTTKPIHELYSLSLSVVLMLPLLIAQIEDDEDVHWKADERETDEEIGARGERFFQSLMQARLGTLAHRPCDARLNTRWPTSAL